MASTYTTNIGIEKIATGEQSGTWGNTTNTNFDIIDQAINGVVSVTLASAGSTGSPNTLDITNGALSNGRNAFIELTDGGDLGGTAYVRLDPSDAEKIVIIRNNLSASRSVILFQGTYNASNDLEVPNGVDMLVKFDGAGVSATVTQVFDYLRVGGLMVDDLIIANSGAVTLYNGGNQRLATTSTGISLQGTIQEDVYALTISAGSANLDPAQGSIQVATMTQNSTFTESMASGDAIVLLLNGGDSYTATFPTTTWISGNGDTAPTLTASDAIVFFQVSTTLYGVYVGSFA